LAINYRTLYVPSLCQYSTLFDHHFHRLCFLCDLNLYLLALSEHKQAIYFKMQKWEGCCLPYNENNNDIMHMFSVDRCTNESREKKFLHMLEMKISCWKWTWKWTELRRTKIWITLHPSAGSRCLHTVCAFSPILLGCTLCNSALDQQAKFFNCI